MQARRADLTVDVDSESDSEKDEPETDGDEDDADAESQDSDEENSAEVGSDEKAKIRMRREAQKADRIFSFEKRFLTERFDGVHLLTVEEVAVMCGVDAESLPHAASLPPLFCASLARCSDFSESFAERFPGVQLIQAEELALICGVNVDSLAPFSALPPIFRELGQPFSEHNSALRLYNASEAAFLCGSSLEAHSSGFRQAVAASDEQRRRVDATRALNATRRQIAIASTTRRRSSRFQATDGRLTSSQLESISTTEPVNTAIATPSIVKPSSPLLSAECTLPSVARAASPAMDIDAAPFALPTTDHYEIQDPEPPSMDVDPAPQALIALWPHAVPLENGMLSVLVLPYNVLPSLMIHTKAAPHMSWECVAYVQCRVILLRLQTALREAQLFSAADARFVAPIKATVETFWGLDNRLFNRISDWCLDQNVHLLGSGLVEPPVVVIANNPFIDDARAFANAIIIAGSRVTYLSRSSSAPPSLSASLQSLSSCLDYSLSVTYLELMNVFQLGIYQVSVGPMPFSISKICGSENFFTSSAGLTSRDPGEFHIQCKALLRDDGAFAACTSIYGLFAQACDKCSRAGKACAKALAQPGCTGCITAKVRCSLQETYLFEKTKHEFDGKRHEFDALRSAKKPRRHTAEEPRRRTVARGPSSIPIARGATAAPNSTMPPPPMFPYPPMQFSDGPRDSSSVSAMLHPHDFFPYGQSGPSFNASGVRDPAHFIDQHIDPALLPPVEDSADTSRLDFVNMRAPSISHMIHQGVQTDNVQDPVDDPVPPLAGTVMSLSTPWTLKNYAILPSLFGSSFKLAFTRGDSGCLQKWLLNVSMRSSMAILKCLSLSSATKHRLRANTSVAPDVLEHIENLSKECHNSLSKMLAQLDEGRRSAPDVFASTISSSSM
ncbi:hypothetical protein C8F04DRAFT_1199718 [Mycena alexandri]|uniref:Uncharacterized protein n=1 Tax=Mycena alexandri TaxID=1745969 RepID=A0AAD6S0C6_9AGAR|nr:hypothetical protein C8F04DRAFT_1199718 [Mycena alexandri]